MILSGLVGECARLLNLDIAGVDLLFDNDSYVICEVNSAPGFKGMEKYTKINVAEQMVDFIKKKYEVNSYYYKRSGNYEKYFIYSTFFTCLMDMFGFVNLNNTKTFTKEKYKN